MHERVVYEQAGWTTAQQDTLRASLDELGLCGCGGNHHEIILLVLERSGSSRTLGSPTLYDACDDASGRWVEFAGKVLDAAALLEHGTGIGCAWPTGQGLELLRFYREFGIDDEKWPEWATAEVYAA